MAAGVSSRDAATSGEIFRKNHPIILACNRHQAHLVPVRLAYRSGGFLAGRLLGKNSTSGYWDNYDNAASSGLDTAVGVLAHDAEPASGSTDMAVMIAGGKVFEDKLLGLDSAARTDLKARTIEDATGIKVLSF